MKNGIIFLGVGVHGVWNSYTILKAKKLYNNSMNDLLEVYELLEAKVGKEEAKIIINAIEKSLNIIEQKAQDEKEIAKTQLKQELLDELLTKGEFYSEIKRLEDKMDLEVKRLEERIDWKTKRLELLLYFIALLMIMLNKGTVEFVLKVFGVK